ncbi:MAG: secretin and TonB N-terminal domain-containing protein [Desulfofustis sp.]|nr:secretin and TonB N-terminal domain-containing protein [Desulfofustis sp.]
MYTRLIKTTLAIISVICLSHSLAQTATAVDQAQTGSAYQVRAIKTEIGSDNLSLLLIGDSAPAYTVSERFDPYRLVVDIAEAEFNSEINLDQILPINDIAKLHLSILKDQQPAIARLEFTLGENDTYDVQRVLNNLQITITAKPTSEIAAEPSSTATSNQDPLAAALFDSPKADLKIPSSSPAEGSEIERMQDSFSFSGYESERISVDFYKIDLHNVFRLFREISSRNIIVDETVNGSITIALNDVPWEFALDIVLNLADLKKEERYNTIVIYPKDKQFLWPERAMDNLSFEADTEVVQQEALIIQESASQPEEVMQAKEVLIKARELEEKENYELAAAQYEKAFQLWPDNAKIGVKLANLYLGRLGMNAKALHFAQQALNKDPSNTRAALYCAISSANMDRLPEAADFFSQSISDNPPLEEALLSYAAFSENNKQNEIALRLLDTYGKHYGDNLHSMISKARIYDKSGERDKATAQYKALLSAGFQMRPDLKEYVERRVANGAL